MCGLRSTSGRLVYQAGAYPGFVSMKKVFLLTLSPLSSSLDGMSVHRTFAPRIELDAAHDFNTQVKRGTMRVKCVAQELNAVLQAGLKSWPFDPGSSALSTKPPRLPYI